MAQRITVRAIAVGLMLVATWSAAGKEARQDSGKAEPPAIEPVARCCDEKASDQDDLCLWVNPKDAARSTVIASDKAADRLFVYDLAGHTLQAIETPHPGNIDLRYGFPLGGRKVDIVAFNQRASPRRVMVYAVDPETRHLARVDNGRIDTGANYGGTLFRSPKTGKVYFVTTSMGGACEQYELADDGTGKVGGTKVRTFQTGFSEAAVGDDARGRIYVGEEQKGVWEVGGEPDDTAPPRLVVRLGANGLRGDVEGLAIHPNVGGGPALVVSNQGRNNFKVYRLGGDFALLGTFTVRGALDTDGLDLTTTDLGPPFAKGLFACHTDVIPRPVLLVPWDRVAEALRIPVRSQP